MNRNHLGGEGLSGEEHIVRGGREKIGRQIVLPLRKAVEIACKSIKIRIWRSLITTSGIILAIAFLTSVWTTSSIRGTLQRVPEDDPTYALVMRALQKQAIAQDSVTIRVGIIGREPAGVEASRNTPAVLVRDALQERQEFNPFLVRASFSAFEHVAASEDPEEKPDAFLVTSFPTSFATTEAVPVLADFVQKGGTLIVLGYERLWPEQVDAAVSSAFDALLPGRPTDGRIKATGDSVKSAEHAAMGDVKWAQHPELTYVQVEPAEGAEPLARFGEEGVLWVASQGQGTVFWYPVAEPRLTDGGALQWLIESRVLVNSLRWGARERFRGGTAAKRNLWLVSLSLLVCIVGITNAMLMSVTERFREIGTMKCLGALDSFVVRLFLIESSFQGAGGSLLGAGLGLLLAFGRALFSYRIIDQGTGKAHWLALEHFPGWNIAFWLLIAVLVGVVLSVLAAIYPAYRAARMEPVEAMRSEA